MESFHYRRSETLDTSNNVEDKPVEENGLALS
jgi:hypothetical protein